MEVVAEHPIFVKMRLKNFKPFSDQSLTFKPLTLLSGFNSTAKSSVLQALLLLRQSYQMTIIFRRCRLGEATAEPNITQPHTN